ncbi:uncharacterized protein [Medicago truncatula]|uniref:uncharacterized protein n=1 Tax=Medicago truncatula TaxID=3880 RepID=UPI000D2F3D98|nr:uncharacterized protein LOC112418537 [Medicago truncatula]
MGDGAGDGEERVHIYDRLWWILDPINGYYVKGTYNYLTTAEVPSEHGLFDDVWQKQVPLKVSVFSFLRNRLPTKDNLLHMRIIDHDDTSCIGGCGSSETADHLLFRCDHFGMVWHRIYQWLGISFIAPAVARAHLHQFGHLAGLPRSTHSFLPVIWMASVWVIWKERNNMIFNRKNVDLNHLAGNVKLMSFSWLKANMPTFAFSYNDWWRHPLLCKGGFV